MLMGRLGELVMPYQNKPVDCVFPVVTVQENS